MAFNLIESFFKKNIQLICTLTRTCSVWKLHFAWVLRRAFHRISIFLLKLLKDKENVVFVVYSSKAGLLNLCTINIWVQIHLCCGDSPVHCRMFSSTHSVYPLDNISTPTLSCDN